MTYVAGQRCDVCGGESPYVPICGECEIAARADVQQDRQARTIRRLRALAAGYRARALRNGQAAASNCETCSEAAEQLERARIVAWLREVAGAVRAEAETQGDTVFGTVAAVQEKTIERLAYLIEEKGK